MSLSSYYYIYVFYSQASQVALVVKNPPANAGDRRHRFDPWVKNIPWRRAWQPTPVFLPGEYPWTEEPGELESIGSQSQAQLKQLSAHTRTASTSSTSN